MFLPEGGQGLPASYFPEEKAVKYLSFKAFFCLKNENIYKGNKDIRKAVS